MTADEIVNYFGGGEKLANALGLKRPAVNKWKQNGVPARYWLAISRLPKPPEVTLDILENHTYPGRKKNG